LPEYQSPESANSLTIEKVIVTADRLGDRSYEIQTFTNEIAIYEHIDLPYLTGKMILADSRDLNTIINFQGTERIEITVSIPDEYASKTVTKKFMVTHVENVTPTNDTSEVMILSLIEEHAYFSYVNAFSKSYEGKIEEIIPKVLSDKLSIDEIDVAEGLESRQKPIRVVIPYWTPLDTVRWLKDRATTIDGLPFYLYSTLNNERLVLTDLEKILQSTIPEGEEYRYGQAFTQDAQESNNLNKQAKIIENYELPKTNDGLRMFRDGFVNSQYNFIDTLSNQSLTSDGTKYTDARALKELEDKGLLSREDGDVFDEYLEFDDTYATSYTSSVISSIVTTGTYDDGFLNYHEERFPIEHKENKVRSSIYRNYLLKNPLNIVLPGRDFLGANAKTVGKKMNVRILKNDQSIYEANEGVSLEDITDFKRSGEYIIYSIRHVMAVNDYRVSLTVARLSEGKRKELPSPPTQDRNSEDPLSDTPTPPITTTSSRTPPGDPTAGPGPQ
jgi:hypothetical protein